MAELRWFAGVPVVARRELGEAEVDRLHDLVRAVLFESLGSYVLVLVAMVGVLAASTMMMARGWLGPIVLGVTSGMLRYVPQRRFFSPRVILRLRRDLVARAVHVCETEEVRIEVLTASHIIWTRDHQPLERPLVAHATTTAMPPPHASIAANFVRPANDGAPYYFHQRALTPEEVAELDSYAPRPLFAVWVLASVGLVGAIVSFGLALSNRLTTLLPPAAFFVIGASATVSLFRSYRARRRITADLEAAFVYIVRRVENDQLSVPQEILPFSSFLWTQDGKPATWRQRARRYER